MPNGNIYSPQEIYGTLKAEALKHETSPNWGRIATGTYIVLRESGGDAKATRPPSQNPGGGTDRGWWQFNSKYFPDVSDVVAYDPVAATAKAYEVSEGFTNFKPWYTDRDPNFSGEGGDEASREHRKQAHTKAAEAAIEAEGLLGNPWSSAPIVGGIIDDTVDAVGGAISSVTGWTEALGNLIGKIMDPTFWKRIGVGALAVLILVAALVLFFKDSVVETVGEVTG